MELKDIAYPLRVAYMSKLKPVLTYNGVPVPVYDALVPENAPDYFVVIREQNEADNSLKCGFNSDVHVTTEVVTRFEPGKGSSAIRDNISSQLNSIICSTDPAERITLKPDFNVMNSIRTLSRSIDESTKTGVILRKVNIYKHTIQQLT